MLSGSTDTARVPLLDRPATPAIGVLDGAPWLLNVAGFPLLGLSEAPGHNDRYRRLPSVLDGWPLLFFQAKEAEEGVVGVRKHSR